MKKLQVLYITAFFAACLVPSLGMAVTKRKHRLKTEDWLSFLN